MVELRCLEENLEEMKLLSRPFPLPYNPRGTKLLFGNEPLFAYRTMSTTSVKMLHTWDTVYSADSVEWCPTPNFQNLFVCGTYQLSKEIDEAGSEVDDAPAKRLGRLHLFSLTSANGLELLQKIDMPAILDLKWCHVMIDNRSLLAVANAKGEVLIYTLRDAVLEFATKLQIGEVDGETLALSLDWSTGKLESEPSITVSDSLGRISLLRWTDSSLVKIMSWKAHDFEAWITAFDYWNTNIIYSGGDDSKFKVYDVRNEVSTPVLTSKTHDAGVTSLHSHSQREHLLASGSYDENLRLWDTRSMKQPMFTTALGGGVWRLKWDPHNSDRLLAACMHGGFQIVNCVKESPPTICASYNEHESLAYGSDWCLNNVDIPSMVNFEKITEEPCESISIISACSFYDHKLSIALCSVK